jgi:formamidopyrimidine-DNA glycosylase
MFELPETITLTRQMNDTLPGKIIQSGRLGNSPHKFVWYNRSHEEFAALAEGKAIGRAAVKGRWMLIPLESGFVLVLGECGGKILYHPPETPRPLKYHLLLDFDDGSALSAMTQMWGAMELYEQGLELEREYIKDMRPTPVDSRFTLEYFNRLVDELAAGKARSVKSLLTQDQIIPGLGNAIAQDIMLRARLHPRRPLESLAAQERVDLYEAICETLKLAIALGGRNDETDLFGQPGSYMRLMDRNRVGKPCPQCGTKVVKMAYLGGTCYVCPGCQGEVD